LAVGVLGVAAVDMRILGGGPVQQLPPDYLIYAKMAREDPYDEYVVLEVPTAAGTGEIIVGDPYAVQLQYHGIVHGKRMVNSFAARAPLENYWYLNTDDPMLSWLGGRRRLEPDVVREQMRERVFGWPIGYVIVHERFVPRESPTHVDVIGYLNTLDDVLCPPEIEKDLVIYATRWKTPACATNRTPDEYKPGRWRIDIGAGNDARYLGTGWHRPEVIVGISVRWATDRALLYADLPPGTKTITVRAQAYGGPQGLHMHINGTDTAYQVVSARGLADYTFAVPDGAVGDGRHVAIGLEFDNARQPDGDDRLLAAMIDWIEVGE
jgi:hypothetical protein